MSKRRNTI